MAELKITGFDKLEKMLTDLADPKPIQKKAIETVLPHAVSAMQDAIRSGSTDRSTGVLAASIEATPVKSNQLGVYSVVRPTGKDSKGVSNSAKLNFLEYGVASHNQAPRPIRAKVAKQVEGELLKTTQELLDKEVEKYK